MVHHGQQLLSSMILVFHSGNKRTRSIFLHHPIVHVQSCWFFREILSLLCLYSVLVCLSTRNDVKIIQRTAFVVSLSQDCLRHLNLLNSDHKELLRSRTHEYYLHFQNNDFVDHLSQFCTLVLATRKNVEIVHITTFVSVLSQICQQRELVNCLLESFSMTARDI
jgi:hypothetical protein